MSAISKSMRAASIAALFFFLNLFFPLPVTSSAAAPAANAGKKIAVTQINGIRFGTAGERERLVIDLGAIPEYTVKMELEGRRYILELKGVSKRSGKCRP